MTAAFLTLVLVGSCAASQPAPTVPSTVPSTAPAVPSTVGSAFAHCRMSVVGCVVDNPAASDVTSVELSVKPDPTFRSLHYGPRAEQLADVYLPTGTVKATIVYLHAGGWVAGSRADIPTSILRQLDAHRAVISVGYRLTSESPWPAQIQDADWAVRWIKVHAKDWGLDPQRIVLAGGSAGGHLALFSAVAPGHIPADDLPASLVNVDPRVVAVVALAAPADVASLLGHEWGPAFLQRLLGCSFDCDPALIVDSSPATHVSASAPPVYLAVGAHDTLVPADVNLFALAKVWAAAVGPRAVWVDLVDNQGHNLDVDGLNVTALDEFLSLVVSR